MSTMMITTIVDSIATSSLPWIALLAGGQFFMAGCLHVFWSDGGKYRAAGFQPQRFDSYTHSILMFMSVIEGSPQILRGFLMMISVWFFPEYTGPLLLLDGLDGICLFFLGGYFFGGIKPVPSPPRGEDGTLPGSKLHAIKMIMTTSFGVLWIVAGRPIPPSLPFWSTIPIPFLQIPSMIYIFSKKFPLPTEAEGIVNDYLDNKNRGAAYQPFHKKKKKTEEKES